MNYLDLIWDDPSNFTPPPFRELKTINGESLIGDGNINVAILDENGKVNAAKISDNYSLNGIIHISFKELIDKLNIERQRAQLAEINIENDLLTESNRAKVIETELSSRIDAIVQGRNVRDIVASKTELNAYDTSTLGNNDIIMVLLDETQSGHTTYYRWNAEQQTFEFIGGLAFTYTKTEIDEKFANLHIVLPAFDENSSQEVLEQVDTMVRSAGADASFKVAIPIDDMSGNVTVTYVRTNTDNLYIGIFADDRSVLYHITRTTTTPREYTCEVITKEFELKNELKLNVFNFNSASNDELILLYETLNSYWNSPNKIAPLNTIIITPEIYCNVLSISKLTQDNTECFKIYCERIVNNGKEKYKLLYYYYLYSNGTFEVINTTMQIEQSPYKEIIVIRVTTQSAAGGKTYRLIEGDFSKITIGSIDIETGYAVSNIYTNNSFGMNGSFHPHQNTYNGYREFGII